MKKLLTTLSILFIATASYAETYTVERVIDGDTLKLTNGETVQLMGINAPDEGIDGYDKATEYLKSLLNQDIRLEFDVQERDKYGRLLAYVWYKGPDYIYYEPINYGIGNKGNADSRVKGESSYSSDKVVSSIRMINAKMVEDGFARPRTIPPNVKYAELFKELYEEARENKRGLRKENHNKKTGMVMCTMDARICPDGSSVGRIPPNCKFKLCPGEGE